MLPCVLLHMVEAPFPIDRAFDAIAINRRGLREMVRDAGVLIGNVKHGCSSDEPGVERLPAGCGIEGSAVEKNSPPVDGMPHNPCVKRAQVGILIVEAFSHGSH